MLGGPLADEHRVVHAVEAGSERAVRETLAEDPWSETHLQIASVEPLDDPPRRPRTPPNRGVGTPQPGCDLPLRAREPPPQAR